jgi:hypothetical protein
MLEKISTLNERVYKAMLLKEQFLSLYVALQLDNFLLGKLTRIKWNTQTFDRNGSFSQADAYGNISHPSDTAPHYLNTRLSAFAFYKSSKNCNDQNCCAKDL